MPSPVVFIQAQKNLFKMRKINIRRRKHENLDGSATLYAELYIRGEKLRIPTGVTVTAEEWDSERQQVRGRSSRARDCNLILSNITARLTDVLVRERLSKTRLTKESFLKAYRQPEDDQSFIKYAVDRLRRLDSVLQPQTITRHLAVLNKLKQYSPALRFSDITPDWLRTYARHLRDAHGNCQSTVAKNMSIIRTHFNAAAKEGKVCSSAFDSFRISPGQPSVVYLTEEELRTLVRLYNEDSLEDIDQDSLRFFLFMAFTAMHISDARALTMDQVYDGAIHYRRIKTGTTVTMPLSEPARKLVEYYRGGRHRGLLITGLPSDQGFNRVIKRVCEGAGITKAVSAKAARHTFATLYLRKNRGDLPTLSKLLGHTKINTTMIYAHILTSSKVEGVNAFNDFL